MATHPLLPTRSGKYVTFQISRHYFAIEAGRVRQVTPIKDISPYEHDFPGLRGVIVFRGRRVPVIDIRDRLGLGERASRRSTCVLLVDTAGMNGLPVLGIVVDRMTDVVEFSDRDFRENVVQMRQRGRPYGRPKTLLDLYRLFSLPDVESLKAIL